MPVWKYGPKGEAQLFQNEKDAPKGWRDTPHVQGDNDSARRERDIPPGRYDRQALAPAIAGIADQVFAEVTARIAAPPTADERPMTAPSVDEERVGERALARVIPDPVRDSGDKQPHLEAHNWTPVDKAKHIAREEKAVQEALARRGNGETADLDKVVKTVESAFSPEPKKEPSVQEIESGAVELTPEQEKAIGELDKIDPLVQGGGKEPAKAANKKAVAKKDGK